MVKKTQTDNVQSLTVPSVSPQITLSELPIESTIALNFFFQDDRNGLGYKNSASKDRLWLLAVRVTTIAFPGTRLGRLSTMTAAVVFPSLRDRLSGVYLALASFVCTIFECHMTLLLAKQIYQINGHERNCSVILINIPFRQKA
jgi:hypothetical protein